MWVEFRYWRLSGWALIGPTLIGCALLFASPAFADDKAQAAASLHFERGAKLFQEGNLDAARVEFQRAYEINPDYRLLYNLAQVQLELHEYVAARDVFERYLSEGADAIAPERRAKVQAELAAIRERIASVAIKVNVAGAAIFVNEQQVGTSPLTEPIQVNAGQSKIHIRKAGFQPQAHTLEVAGQDRAQLVVELLPEASAATRPGLTTTAEDGSAGQSASSSAERASYTPVWWSAGAAVLLGGVAGTFGYLAHDADQSLSTEFNRLPANPDRIDTLSDRVRVYSWVADGATAGAVVAAAIAVYFLIDPPMQSVGEDHGSLRVIPVADGAGVEVAF
jgi:tetratricopeptide (TPR) repeat protein